MSCFVPLLQQASSAADGARSVVVGTGCVARNIAQVSRCGCVTACGRRAFAMTGAGFRRCGLSGQRDLGRRMSVARVWRGCVPAMAANGLCWRNCICAVRLRTYRIGRPGWRDKARGCGPRVDGSSDWSQGSACERSMRIIATPSYVFWLPSRAAVAAVKYLPKLCRQRVLVRGRFGAKMRGAWESSRLGMVTRRAVCVRLCASFSLNFGCAAMNCGWRWPRAGRDWQSCWRQEAQQRSGTTSLPLAALASSGGVCLCFYVRVPNAI
jgi:hypothetical protein